MKIGVPFDVAWDMVEAGMWPEITAYIVTAGEADGGKYDWDRMNWVRD